jgi:hypothetical protein
MTPRLIRRLTKIVAFLTALLGSALIMVSGEQVGSTEKWTAPAAEARKKNPVAVTESSLAAGQKIYLKRCPPGGHMSSPYRGSPNDALLLRR